MRAAALPATATADEGAELTAEQRKELADKATALNGAAIQMYQRGDYVRATEKLRDALEIRRRLYPKDKLPDGHPDLAQGFNNLGFILGTQGAYSKAEPLYREALAMYERLYPKDKYPHGNPELALTRNNMGDLFHAQG